MSRENAARPTARVRRRRPVLWIVGIAGAIVVVVIAAAVIPRWWAQRVADVVDGRLSVGALYGLFVGFVFTFAPIAVGIAVVRWRTQERSWLGWIAWLAVILLAAAPNLMTLGIVVGRGNASHAGERILDVDAPGFRAWSLIGVLAAIGAAAGLTYELKSRRRSRAKAGELRRELHAREQPRPDNGPDHR